MLQYDQPTSDIVVERQGHLVHGLKEQRVLPTLGLRPADV